jgi:hypothetical protein
MSIGNYVYFCFYGSVFKICQCFTGTYCPQTWGPCTQLQDGAISCQRKYLTLIFFCLFAGWGEYHGKQGWLQAGEDMHGCSRKVARFKMVHEMDFKPQQEYIHIKICFCVLCKHIHICIYMNYESARWMAENIGGKKCSYNWLYKQFTFKCSNILNLLMLVEEDAVTSSSVCSWWRIKGPVAHYLEVRSFGWHAIRVLCSANTLVILGVLLQRKNKFVLVFIIPLLQKCFHM